MREFFETEVELKPFYDRDAKLLGLVKGKEEFEAINTKEVKIRYEAVIDIRSWGISDIYFELPKQEIEIEYSYYPEGDSEELVNATKKIELKNTMVTIEFIEQEKSSTNSIFFLPQSLEFENGFFVLKIEV